MTRALLITVRLHDGRYHGTGPWPPAPARLFQALVAGASEGGVVPQAERAALAWLEGLAPPVIAAPAARSGQAFKNYVPNNDLDAEGGDPNRIANIRTPKGIRPRLFDSGQPLLYAWRFDADDGGRAKTLVALAGRLYQLGRGVDMAWALGEVLGADELEARLAGHGGAVHRPGRQGNRVAYACPVRGSLASLEHRFKAMGERLKTKGKQQLFFQPPKPRFAQVTYDSPVRLLLFDLRDTGSGGGFFPWPFTDGVRLVETVRDSAEAKLRRAYVKAGQEAKAAMVERVFIGRNAAEADKAQRIRIVPLPSIGHVMAENSIRRVLVEVPPDCPLSVEDITWAFDALTPIDPESGEVLDEQRWRLVVAEDRGMLRHYGMGEPSRPFSLSFGLWRTITPAALPERAARRRIDPARIREEAKNAAERLAEEGCAVAAVHAALRHAGVKVPVQWVRVQREPFHLKGARAEDFAAGTRFSKHRLWHVEISFLAPVTGSLVIGDGRYLGLGLMAPEPRRKLTALRYALVGERGPEVGKTVRFAEVVRAALMKRAADVLGDKKIPWQLSGHDRPQGCDRKNHDHAFFLPEDTDGDGRIDHVTVHAGGGFQAEHQGVFAGPLELWDGRRGAWRLMLEAATGRDDAVPPESVAPLLARARAWVSRTPYLHPWHRKSGFEAQEQVRKELRLRGFPDPIAVERLETITVNGKSLRPTHFHRFRAKSGLVQPDTQGCFLRITFPHAVAGPLALGFAAHFGLGLFGPEDP